jgi:phospholipid N-methyltransferase
MQAISRSFLRNFIRYPRRTGAVAPATRSLAASVGRTAHEAYLRHGAGEAGEGAGLKLIELGAGTGALTQGLCSMRPVLVEKDEHWAILLQNRFPSLEVRQECATDTLRALQEPAGVVSSIPLLNNPQSAELKQLLDQRYRDGLLKFCVLYTYGWTNPLAGSTFREARRASFVPRSLPPAYVWIYQ